MKDYQYMISDISNDMWEFIRANRLCIDLLKSKAGYEPMKGPLALKLCKEIMREFIQMKIMFDECEENLDKLSKRLT